MLDRPEHGDDARRRTTEDLAWLRSLARRIASSPTEADDLAQEAWLAAEHGRGDARSRRAWLGGVVRNRERMHRRSEARRRMRETRAATMAEAAAEPPDPSLELHRRRVLAAMREALDELDQSDRQLLLARYCDEHDARALSERLGIPASTVRSRLSRATARVRRSLDERWGGDRRAWAPAILAAPLPARPPSPAPFGWRALLMAGLGKKLWITLAVVLCATGWWAVSRDDDERTTEGTVLAAEAPDSGLLPRTVHGTDPVDSTRAVLGGRVLQADSDQPLAGAVVLVTPVRGPSVVLRERGAPAHTPRVLTRADGSFTVDHLPPGSYRVTAAKDGFLPARDDAIELVAGAEHDGTILRLTPGGNLVEGVVTDIGGGVVEGTLVHAWRRRDGSRVRYGAVTDGEGRYRMTLPDGSWRLTAGGEDYTAQHRRVHLDHGPGRADFVLVPGAAIHGRVLARTTREPVANAAVGFRFEARRRGDVGNRTSSRSEMVQTDAAGRFRMHPLAPGVYELYASAEGMATEAIVEVHAAIGEEVTEVELLTDPVQDVRGRVVDAAAPERGLAGVQLAISSMSDLRESFATTAPDGTFTLPGLLPGSYVVGLEGPRVISAALRPLEVTGEERNDVVFELGTGTTVRGRVEPASSGRVRIALSEPPRDFDDFVRQESLVNASAPIRADGSFSIDTVPLGTWNVVADADDGSHGEHAITVEEGGVEELTVRLEPTDPGPAVKGRLLDATGTPVAGVEVGLRKGSARKAVAAGTSAADGRFEVRDVEPGEYRLALVDPKSRPLAVQHGPSVVQVAAGRDTDGLELHVELPRARIEGVVLDPSGASLADAWVTAVPSADVHAVVNDQDVTVITDPSGRFSFEDLRSGDYDLFVRGPDADARGHARGVSTDGAPIRIELEQLGEIRGIVTKGGAPVTRFTLDVGVSRRTVISADGRFELLRIDPGSQRIGVHGPEGSAFAEVDVESGRTQTVELQLQPWGTVHGAVVSLVDGEPLADMRLDIVSSSGTADDDAGLMGALTGQGGPRSDARGHFSVDGIGAGRGELIVRVGTIVEGTQPLGRRPFTLTPGGTLDLGVVAVLPPSRIEDDERGRLGMDQHLAVRAPSPDDPTTFHDPVFDGPRRLWVTRIQPGGPAARAGVQVGDLVTAIDGMSHDEIGFGTLCAAMDPSRIRVGQRYELRLERDGVTRTVTLEAAARPE